MSQSPRKKFALDRMKVYWCPPLMLLFLHIGVFCSIGQSIRIESAYYGPPNRVGVDVTRRVQRFADYGEPFRVGNDTLRIDPAPNHPKALVVIYDVNGRRFTECVPEGDVFYFRNGGESNSNLENHRDLTFELSGRCTAREDAAWASQASFARWRETAEACKAERFAYCLFAKASSRLRRSMTNELLSP